MFMSCTWGGDGRPIARPMSDRQLPAQFRMCHSVPRFMLADRATLGQMPSLPTLSKGGIQWRHRSIFFLFVLVKDANHFYE